MFFACNFLKLFPVNNNCNDDVDNGPLFSETMRNGNSSCNSCALVACHSKASPPITSNIRDNIFLETCYS